MIRRPNPEYINALKEQFPIVLTIDNIVRFYKEDLVELWPEYPRVCRIIGHMYEDFMDQPDWGNQLNEARYGVVTGLSRKIIRRFNLARARHFRRPTNFRCPICLDNCARSIKRNFCGHYFHAICLQAYHVDSPGKCPFRCRPPIPHFQHYLNARRERQQARARAEEEARFNLIWERDEERYIALVGPFSMHVRGNTVYRITARGTDIPIDPPINMRRFMRIDEIEGIELISWCEEKIGRYIDRFAEYVE